MFGTWIGRIVKKYDYFLYFVSTLPLSVYEGTWTHCRLSFLCITMILHVRRKVFEITMFPNKYFQIYDDCHMLATYRPKPSRV